MRLFLILAIVFAFVFFTACASPNSVAVKGADGKDGKDGRDGKGCQITKLDPDPIQAPYGGAVIECSDSFAVLTNGAPGLNVPPTAYSIVDHVDPCGDVPAKYDEILLRLQNGQLIGSISDKINGENTRLGFIPPGSWYTTDGTGCHFTVTSSLQVIW